MEELKRNKTCWVNIRVSPEDRDTIEKLAKEQGVSMSVLCMEAVAKVYPVAIGQGRINAIAKVLADYEQKLSQ